MHYQRNNPWRVPILLLRQEGSDRVLMPNGDGRVTSNGVRLIDDGSVRQGEGKKTWPRCHVGTKEPGLALFRFRQLAGYQSRQRLFQVASLLDCGRFALGLEKKSKQVGTLIFPRPLTLEFRIPPSFKRLTLNKSELVVDWRYERRKVCHPTIPRKPVSEPI